jgi:hypothetical protein
LNQQIQELGKVINDIKDSNIQNLYREIVTAFNNGSEFSSIQRRIENLNVIINEYLKPLIFQNNEPIINDIYQSLVTRYGDSVRKVNIVKSPKVVENLLTTFTLATQLFQEGCRQQREIEYFELLNHIKFQEKNQDYEILDALNALLKPSDIYVSMYYRPYGSIPFYYYNREKGLLYECYAEEILTEKMTEKKFQEKLENNEYIPLEKLFDYISYNGRLQRDQQLNYYQIILYENEKICLTYTNNVFRIQPVTDIHDSNKRESIEETHSKFRSTAYTCRMIGAQIKDREKKFDDPKSLKTKR